MSRKMRGRQPTIAEHQQDRQQANRQQRSPIRATVKRPLQHAALSVASAVLASSAAAQDIALPTIDVMAAGGYQTTNSGLLRVPTPLRDTAQTINVVPQQVMQEQNVTSVREALRNVAGVTFRAGEGGNQ